MKAAEAPTRAVTRRRWSIRGQVQGVGFRPFVYRMARELQLAGWVRNDSSSVVIEAQGSWQQVEAFADRLISERPHLARYDAIEAKEIPVVRQSGFEIGQSQADQEHRPTVTADSAVCSDCLREMADPADFRSGYGLINCTNCGPRYSIIRAMPYDRVNTTMAQFGLCEKCHQQYLSPADRRFHAQPVACEKCGPRVSISDLRSEICDSESPIAMAAEMLIAGKIVAIKGIGGFHLACRADDAAAVRLLRTRKHRDSKPFALMVANLAAAKELVELSADAERELTSPAAPIILGKQRRSDEATQRRRVAEGVAPGTDRLGIMLPYTPIQHLLLAALNQQSAINTLVMTSANLSDEPLVKDNGEACTRLEGIADAILWHDRDIERCVDDSILLDMGRGQEPLPIRRARGYVPTPIIQSTINNQQPGLCVGGELKNTVAVVRGDEIILSQHLGDLKHALAYEYFQTAIEDLCRLMEVKPAWIAHDLHPAYLSTQWAKQLAAKWNVPLVGVQHHHAHAAAVLAEHGVTEPALAVACDGVGYGTDGTAWGGELLAIRGGAFERLAHLRPIQLPGGDAAAKDTRRCAAGLLWDMGMQEEAGKLFEDGFERQMVLGMLRSGTGCVTSSAAGRVFDAVAGLLGVCYSNDHEARAPMALEALAGSAKASSGLHFSPRRYEETKIREAIPGVPGTASCSFVPSSLRGENGTPSNELNAPVVIDLRPLIAELIGFKQSNAPAADLAARFHEGFARAWADAVQLAAEKTGIRTVGLSGGVFCNALLTKRLSELLMAQGLRVLRHEVVPPNDGGIAFGQAAVAARRERVTCA